MFSTAVLASAVDTNSSNISSAVNAYISFLGENDIDESTTGYFADVTGDEVPELIFEALYGGVVAVYSYDYASSKVVQLFASQMGKGYAMDVYVNADANRIIVPSASTGGSEIKILDFTDNKQTLVKSFKRLNGKYADDVIPGCYHLDSLQGC